MAAAMRSAVWKSASFRMTLTVCICLSSNGTGRSTSAPPGILAVVGWLSCRVLPPAVAHIATQNQRALGLRVDLAIGAVERSHQQDSAFERARVAR